MQTKKKENVSKTWTALRVIQRPSSSSHLDGNVGGKYLIAFNAASAIIFNFSLPPPILLLLLVSFMTYGWTEFFTLYLALRTLWGHDSICSFQNPSTIRRVWLHQTAKLPSLAFSVAKQMPPSGHEGNRLPSPTMDTDNPLLLLHMSSRLLESLYFLPWPRSFHARKGGNT